MEIGSIALKYWLEFGFGLFAALITFGYKQIYQKMKESQKEQDSIKNGIQALLRDRIIQLHSHRQEKGYCPIYALESAMAMFKEYEALGGNGPVKRLIDDLNKMPTKPEEG